MQPKVLSYTDQSSDITVVRLEGDDQGSTLDIDSAPELRAVLTRLAEDGRLILVVDLSVVDDVDSTGLGVLVGGLKRVHVQGGTLSLVVTNDRVRAILSKTGLTKVFRVHDNVPSAVATLVADYAEEGIEQRRAAIVERQARKRRVPEKGVLVSGDHTYEHVSEDITLVNVMSRDPGGEISVSTAPTLRELIVDLINQGRYFLVVDLTSVELLDSTGVGVLVGGLKRIRAHSGAIALVVPSERVLKMFRITGLTKVFPIFATVDPAVEFLGREVPAAHV
ncbi:anti-sigma factor antagonist [Streptomyces sp. LBUM 1486]|nr:anti-sigma factor antagonist [Streptomyces sp. LBUM 1485]MBP5916741.1 anti-sigma factor antagonist [Streptomyces sp. LBUM 1486]QTU54101.1 anti-sigma factor antagonist [Streptomyces sp. LBUM 1480]